MWLDLGPRAPFVIAAYAAVLVTLSALVAWLILDGREQQRRLDEFAARGIKRRSEREPRS
jgi:heme exporter protein CcmD